MEFLYLLFVKLYGYLLKLLSPFHSKAQLLVQGRKNQIQKLENQVDTTKDTLWFHAASLGEFEQARPLIERIKHQQPNYKIALSFFSPSGYEIRKNYPFADYIFYLPEDTAQNAKALVEILQPQAVFFIKYEFWHFYLKTISEHKIPLYLISGIFREKQVFFQWYGKWFVKMLHRFTHFFVQNQESAQLLAKKGFSNVSISGDTRFDRVWEVAQQAKKLTVIEKFTQSKACLIAGSSWDADEELLCQFINENKDLDIKYIIAPHETDKKHIQAILSKLTDTQEVAIYSEAKKTDLKTARVLVIDTIGILSSVYAYGQVAYVGGGFGKGIHNILEPAAHALPIIIGTNNHKFQEAQDLLKSGGALEISNYQDLSNAIKKLFLQKEYLEQSSKIAVQYVKQQRGASEHILKKINLS